ncbi:MAG: hypothetical protein M1822_000688 [Bathelium mastoideum]|nr:MAG: hypothetical protein M1822_000688 [Bathelium mastoideum]
MASSDLLTLGRKLAAEGPHKLEKSPRRVRALYKDSYIVDTQEAQYVWEHPYYPQYWLPISALQHVQLSEQKEHPEGFTTGSLSNGSASIPNVLAFTKGPLEELVRIPFNSTGIVWFEEDEQVFVHPKDPYKRVDILPSTRHIKIGLDGQVLAESSNVLCLFETGLPTRYYLPKTSVSDWALLKESSTTTKCPYKGEANYYSVKLASGELANDLVWYYIHPTSESIGIAGRLCFYNEKVDVWVDGVKQERPKSKFGGDTKTFIQKMTGKGEVGGLPAIEMSHDKAMFGKAS